MLATGTQTGGSVIRPAAFCGVVGYKPSFGHFAVAGMKANTEWLDTIGAYARSVEDIALFRAALMAIPYRPIAKLDTPPRIAVCFTPAQGRAVSPRASRRSRTPRPSSPRRVRKVSEIELPAPVRDMTRGPEDAQRLRRSARPCRRGAALPDLLSESLKKDKLAAGAKIDYATWVAARKLGETRPCARSTRCSPTSTSS